MTKWLIELGEFDILYYPRTSLKRQVVTNFIAEFIKEVIISLDIEKEHHDKWPLYGNRSYRK